MLGSVDFSCRLILEGALEEVLDGPNKGLDVRQLVDLLAKAATVG